MPTKLPLRREARQSGASFLFPLAMFVVLTTLAMVSILWFPMSDRVNEIPVSESNVFAGP